MRRKRAGVQQRGSHDTIRTPQEHTDSHQGARKVTFSPVAADGLHPALTQSRLKHPILVIEAFFFKTQLSPAGGCLAVFHSYWATAPPCGLLRSHVWCTLSTRLLNGDWDGPGDQRLGRPVSILGVNACEKHTEVMTSTKITVQEVYKTLSCVGLIILIPYSHLYI